MKSLFLKGLGFSEEMALFVAHDLNNKEADTRSFTQRTLELVT